MQNSKSSPSDPKSTRKLKPLVSDAASSNPASKAAKETSQKVVDRKAPRVGSSEKKKPNKDSELESQLAHLQEEFKKAKEQLSCNESLKIRYQKEVEEARRKLLVMSAKLQETEQQLDEVSESEEARVQELRKISHDRDKAWQSELEAMQKQHILDSNALASAMNEINRLKARLERISQFEAEAEIRSLRIQLREAVVLVGKLEVQLNDSRESEAQVIEELRVAEEQLEVIKTSEETLRLELAKALGSHSSVLVELEQSKNRLRSLEEHISEVKDDQSSTNTSSITHVEGNGEHGESEIEFLKNEVSRLRGSLMEAERMYQEEYIHCTLEIKNAFEFVEQLKSAYDMEDAKSKGKINESMAEVEELRKRLMEAENELKGNMWKRESELELKLMQAESCLENFITSLIEKEVQLQTILEQNTTLISETIRAEKERNKANEMVIALSVKEEESLRRLGSPSENHSFRTSHVVTEELDASKVEMEAELRTLKVQCDQWRKAAEVAAAMLSAGSNGKSVERSSSFNLPSFVRGISFSHYEDTDEDSPKKRNNMLKKISVLLKKGQKQMT